ncbi:MAG: zinc-binding dehydrogenase [Sphingopyxis sp.]|nr:zinc-binding dehydrogenase [Sphingopyxis sp.]
MITPSSSPARSRPISSSTTSASACSRGSVPSPCRFDRRGCPSADHCNHEIDRIREVAGMDAVPIGDDTRPQRPVQHVDVVFEHVGKDTFPGSMLCLKRGGRLVTCGSTSGVSADINLMQLFQQQLRLIGSFGCSMRNMADTMEKMAQGIVAPVIDREVTMDTIGDALSAMETRNVFGKIILRVSG